MISERVFNVFMYFDAGTATQYGVRHHRLEGSEEQKTRHLLTQIEADHPVARRFNLARSFTADEWRAAMRFGGVLAYFEEAFVLYNAPSDPVYCLTPIVDGVPTVDKQIGVEPFRGDDVSRIAGRGSVPDYLVTYVRENNFHLTELINDDYFKAIKLLFNEGLHVSSAKLLMSCIDTLAFVEFGDVRGNFGKWLDTYVDIQSCGVTSEEVWEFRNSVLHMTNLASKKVLAGAVSPIMPYVGGPDRMERANPNLPKPFNLYAFLTATYTGIAKWGDTFADPDKMLKFIERYDLTISDSRTSRFPARETAE